MWRRLGLYLLLFGMAGLGVELLLLGHYEDPWQWVPLSLLGIGLITGGIFVVRPAAFVVSALRALMATYVLAAGLGVFFHLKSNVEFELELRPSIGAGELVVETLKGAIPALAPGAIAQLGLLGLLVCYKHPLSTRVTGDLGSPSQEV